MMGGARRVVEGAEGGDLGSRGVKVVVEEGGRERSRGREGLYRGEVGCS